MPEVVVLRGSFPVGEPQLCSERLCVGVVLWEEPLQVVFGCVHLPVGAAPHAHISVVAYGTAGRVQLHRVVIDPVD